MAAKRMRSLSSPRWWLAPALLVVAACFGDAGSPDTTLPADLDPVGVVGALFAAIDEGRFDDTTALTDVEQASLVSLAEGADASEIVGALEEDADAVAANFWSGFAQTLDADFDPDGVALEAGERIELEGRTWVPVTVRGVTDTDRIFYLRNDEGWKIDLMATFGHILAERLVPRVEALLSSANTNAATIIGLLRESAPSLQVAAQHPDLDLATHQALLALLERVTRAS